MAGRLLTLCKTVDRRLWAFENPLRQFSSLSPEILRKLEAGKLTVDRMRDMPPEEIGTVTDRDRIISMRRILDGCMYVDTDILNIPSC